MKIRNKLKLGVLSTVLVSPFIALPLINAAQTIDKSIDKPANVDDLIVNITQKSYFRVAFKTNSQWGTYGEVNRIYIDNSEVIENWEVPGTVIQKGVEYKLRRLDASNDSPGKGTIRRLDLSKAEWLDEIASHCFDHYDGTHIKLNWVNFKGAKRLTKIGDYAFSHQYFDSSFGFDEGVIDLSHCTQFTTIGESAFHQCCDDNKNVFNGIIFPPSYTTQKSSAFSSDNEKCRIRFKKIVFTNDNPPTNLFKGGIPRIDDKNSLGIVVPAGCKDRYINHTGFEKAYANCVYESNLKYDDSHRGSLKLCLSSNTSSYDNGTKNGWTPVNSEGQEQKDCKLFLSDTIGDKLYIDSNNRLNWHKGIEPGEYTVRVYGYRYDDTEGNKMSFVTSSPITLSVTDAKLTGGSTYLNIGLGAGQDKGEWAVDLGQQTPTHAITKVDWDIVYKPQQLDEKVSLEPNETNKTAVLKWNNIVSDDAGSYKIIFNAEVTQDWCENTYTLTQEVLLDVIDNNIVVKYTINGNETSYAGETIEIDSTTEIDFKLTIPQGYNGPQLSISGITPQPAGENTYTFKFNSSKDLKGGLYQFYARSDNTDKTKNEVYSLEINVLINKDQEVATNIPSAMDIKKGTKGTQTFKVISDDTNATINKIDAKPATWQSTDTRLGNKLKFSISEDKKSIIAEWTQDYWLTNNAAGYDKLEVALDMTLDCPNSIQRTVWTTMTVYATNQSSIKYDSTETKIKAVPGCSTTSDPFIFEVNGVASTSKNLLWGVYCEDDSLKEHLHFDSQQNPAYLTCDLLNGGVEEGVYDIAIYSYDEDNVTASYINIPLEVKLTVNIADAPKEINMVAHTAGKHTRSLSTYLGETYIKNPTYSIKGCDGNISVDKDGFITWNDKIDAGTYEICLTSKVVNGSKTYESSVYIKINVTAQPGNSKNIGAIVGGSVGGAVAVGGAATGTTLGIKKHRLPRGKKK